MLFVTLSALTALTLAGCGGSGGGGGGGGGGGPSTPTLVDRDGDGVADTLDAFPDCPSASVDTDADGKPDGTGPGTGADAQLASCGLVWDDDDDGDGRANDEDAFPRDPAELADLDQDGVGDNADPDIDGDGVGNAQDAFPLCRWASVDTDRDGKPDGTSPRTGTDAQLAGFDLIRDIDDDGDGIANAEDPLPLIAGTPEENPIVVVAPPGLNPLNQTAVPEPPNLFLFVRNKLAAIRLGKALFWDMQVGSDGIVSCATCHFSAGADSRKKNQLNPGTNAGDTLFGNNRIGGYDYPQFGPNYALQPNDLQLHERQYPSHLQSDPILRDTNDVVSSQGVRLSQFVAVVPGSAVDEVTPIPDEIFHHPDSNAPFHNTRRVEPRNTPTVINAVFNFTNFWDGRANFLFNGENPFGPADPDAGVWFSDPLQGLVKRPVTIPFASLASQAVGPPLSDFEMSARGRTFPDIGRKMLSLTPLGRQLVHPGDSVLGHLSRASMQPDGTVTDVKGLNVTYRKMIEDAFQQNLWNSPDLTPDGFTQMEANFSLFFGLAVQLYEATLVSDQTPFDHWLAGDANALNDQEKLGFALFSGIGNCTVCHLGIELTTASATAAAFTNNFLNLTIELMFVSDGTQVIYDEGFINTSTTPTSDDVGRGGTAPFVNPLTGEPYPLSFSSLAKLHRQGLLPFETPILPLFLPANMPFSAKGCFKVPGLRNVALTAPYFHNGSIKSLEDVVDLYVRGGNFPTENLDDLDPIVGAGNPLLRGRGLETEVLHDALVAFLKSLTDPRVVAESAPFDHPEIFIPEGDPEILLRLPARDADGKAAQP
jgi:cytochrome c peroxidase